MNFRLFQYPIPAPPDLTDLNAFLGANRVVAVHHYVTPSGVGSTLVFLVQTVGASTGDGKRPENKIDYRQELGEEQFRVFDRLRVERKKIAEEEGVPVYTIFSNAQLAAVVKNGLSNPEELARLDGVGADRARKYGPRILAAREDRP